MMTKKGYSIVPTSLLTDSIKPREITFFFFVNDDGGEGGTGTNSVCVAK
jgi:hypothetical protein